MPDTFLQERQQAHARSRLGAVFTAPDRAFAIHYALQELRRDRSDGAPPVAAVALRNIGSGREHIFSLKAEAEAAGLDISKSLSRGQLIALEYSLLFNLYAFIEAHRSWLFVHWYMRDEGFGFLALEKRFRQVLSELSQTIYGARSVPPSTPFGFGQHTSLIPIQIEPGLRVDLAGVLDDLYGIGPVGLRKLAESNDLSVADMIEGIHEPGAFRQGNHAHLAWSCATKARLIGELAVLASRGTIRPPRKAAAGEGNSKRLRVFINYRREDTEAIANWLHELLSQEFGSDNVFIDTDDIPAGIDFEAYLLAQIEACDVFLAVIGKGWAGAVDAKGQRRLSSDQDFVRKEIRAALARGVPVIPVLVEGAPIPTEGELPGDLQALPRRMAVELRSREFRQNVGRLATKIRETVQLEGRMLRGLRR